MASKKDRITWHIERRKVASLIPADYNPRKLSQKAKADLMESVTRFGQVEPSVINLDGTLIGGHQRGMVYADLGIEECDVMVPSRQLNDAEERELNIRLNKNVGDWDWSKLKEFFDVGQLVDAGFGEDELAAFFDKTSDVREDDFDAEAEYDRIKKPTTVAGDVIILGDHRLVCGDSTDPGVFARLFEGGVTADMCWTDPPYNVNYNHRKKYGSIRKGRKKEFAGGSEVINDHMSDQDFGDFLNKVFANIAASVKDGGGIYVCYATKSTEQFFTAFKGAGFHFSQTIIWLKERIILSMGQDYHRVYEPIIYGWKKGQKRWSNKKSPTEKEVWDADKLSFEERLDVWFIHRDKSKDYEHPTQKPVRLSERAIKKSSPIGGIVVEPFCGSGSALMACEQLGRKCFAVEMDPRYCDVVIRRWEKFTGKKIVRI